MVFTLRSVKVPPNSVSLEEARDWVFDFFRAACRSIPATMDIYYLDDVVTASQLRSTVASEIRKNSHVTNPKRMLEDSLLVVRKIENVATGPNNRPKLPCIIAECGEM